MVVAQLIPHTHRCSAIPSLLSGFSAFQRPRNSDSRVWARVGAAVMSEDVYYKVRGDLSIFQIHHDEIKSLFSSISAHYARYIVHESDTKLFEFFNL